MFYVPRNKILIPKFNLDDLQNIKPETFEKLNKAMLQREELA